MDAAEEITERYIPSAKARGTKKLFFTVQQMIDKDIPIEKVQWVERTDWATSMEIDDLIPNPTSTVEERVARRGRQAEQVHEVEEVQRSDIGYMLPQAIARQNYSIDIFALDAANLEERMYAVMGQPYEAREHRSRLDEDGKPNIVRYRKKEKTCARCQTRAGPTKPGAAICTRTCSR